MEPRVKVERVLNRVREVEMIIHNRLLIDLHNGYMAKVSDSLDTIDVLLSEAQHSVESLVTNIIRKGV